MGGCASTSGGSSRPSLTPFLSTPFANYLTSAQLTTFSIYFTELTFTPSSIIFRTNDTAGDYYIFLSGQAHVFAEHKFLCEKSAGDTINTTIITSASLASPAALKQLSSSPLPRHTCSLHAISTTRLLYLSHKKLVEYIRNNPDTSTLLLPLFSCPFVTLSSLSFFSSMPPAHLHTLSCYMLRMQALKPTEMLFEEGSLGQSVYILQAGQLKAVAALTSTTDTKDTNAKPAADPTPATANSIHGSETEKVLHIFRDSNADDRIFGEIALCMDIPRTASIISMSNSIVLEWKREDYRTFTSLLQSTAQSMASLQQMMKARTAEHFRKYKVPFFSSIPEEKYAILASLCKIEERGAGEVIFHEGERGSEFYLIAYGQVRVTMKRKKKEGVKADDSKVAAKKGDDTHKLGDDKKKTDSTKAIEDGYASTKGGTAGTMKGTIKGGTGTVGRNKRQTLMGTLRRRRRTNSSNPQASTTSTAVLASLLALDDDSVEICRMGPGKYFGEIALVQDTPRTATVTALSRCIILSITKENFTLFFHEAPEAISDFEIKLARYDVQLRSVLYHPLGLQWFRRHCEREYASENVEFWLKCREYRHRSMEAMGKEREEKRKVRRDERVRREKEKAGSGAGQVHSPKSASKPSSTGFGLDARSDEDEKAGGAGEKKEATEGNKEEEESTEFADSDYIDTEEDTSDLEYLQRVSLQQSFTSHLLSQLSTLFTVFSLSSSISRTTSLTITASQLKSLVLMLDIYISDYQLDELCIALQEHNDTIAFRPLVDTCLAITHSPAPSHTTTDRILRKLCRRICQYDLADVRRVFEQTAKQKRGFLNLNEFTHSLKRLHIRVRSKEAKDSGGDSGASGESSKENDEQDVSLLFFRLAQPLSFSTRMSSTNFQLSFPMFLSFILNHFHYHESFYSQLLGAAQSIHDTYISSSSSHQVNIKGRTQAAITASISQQRQYREDEEKERSEDEADDERLKRRANRRQKWSSLGVHLFDEGEEEVLNLLGADTFARFKQSELFQEFLSSAQAYVEVKAGSGSKGDKVAGASSGSVGVEVSAAKVSEAEREKMRQVGEEIRRGKMLRSGSVVRETEKRQPAALPPPPKATATLPPLPAASRPAVAATAVAKLQPAPSGTRAVSAVPPPPSRPPPPIDDEVPPPPPPADDFIPPPPSTRSIPPPPPAAAPYSASTVKRRGNLPPFNAQLYTSSTMPRQPQTRQPVTAAVYAAPPVQMNGAGMGGGVKYVEEKQQEAGTAMQPVTIMLDPFQSRY